MTYEYKMVQIPPNIRVSASVERGQEAAWYLQDLVNRLAKEGWEFYRVDTVGVISEPGCLGQLLGQKATLVEYFVVTFRRPVPSQE